MTTFDNCPDELTSGQATDANAHARGCAACRATLLAAAAFDGEAIVQAGDDLLLARAVEQAIRAAPRTTRARRRWSRGESAGVRRMAVAGIVVLLAVGTALAAWRALRQRDATPAARAPEQKVVAAVPVPQPAAASPAAASPAAASPAAAALAPTADQVLARPGGGSTGDGPSALLRRARLARAAGDRPEARRLYQTLLRRFPGSGKAAVARVSLGTLLLEETDPASARTALAAFDGYLAIAQRGTLREEALVGRARAFARLGDTEGERAAWRALLQEFPGSVHAPLARRRAGAGNRAATAGEGAR